MEFTENGFWNGGEALYWSSGKPVNVVTLTGNAPVTANHLHETGVAQLEYDYAPTGQSLQ